MLFPENGMEVRTAASADAEPLLRTLCAAFGLDCDAARPLFYRDPYYDLSLKHVLTTPADGIVACLTIIPAMLVIRGVLLTAAGIAGVATHPAHRRQGYASLLLTETLRMLAEEGRFSVSALFPYSDTFYRRLGWETATHIRHWKGTIAPGEDNLLADCVRPVSLGNPRDLDWLREMRAALPPEQTGLCRRDRKRWQVLEMTAQTWAWHAFDACGMDGGYVALQRPENDAEPIIIQEMVASSAEARCALAAFLGRISGGQKEFWWAAPAGQPDAFGLPTSPDFEVIEPGMMLRPVSITAVLYALYAGIAPLLRHAQRSLTLQIFDAPGANGTQAMCLAPNGIFPGSPADRERIQMPVGTLAPLLTGACLPSALAAEGTLQASSPETLAFADAVFPLAQPFLASADQF